MNWLTRCGGRAADGGADGGVCGLHALRGAVDVRRVPRRRGAPLRHARHGPPLTRALRLVGLQTWPDLNHGQPSMACRTPARARRMRSPAVAALAVGRATAVASPSHVRYCRSVGIIAFCSSECSHSSHQPAALGRSARICGLGGGSTCNARVCGVGVRGVVVTVEACAVPAQRRSSTEPSAEAVQCCCGAGLDAMHAGVLHSAQRARVADSTGPVAQAQHAGAPCKQPDFSGPCSSSSAAKQRIACSAAPH